MTKNWDDYWQEGHLTSLSADYKGNYGGEFLQLWQHYVGQLKQSFTMLDLATGNGAIPFLVREHLPTDVTGKIVGVDKALVRECHECGQVEVRIQGNTEITALPFSDSSFDYITSQFGFEYAAVQPALIESFRVLKTGGRMFLVIHHQDSVIVKRNLSTKKFIESPLLNAVEDALIQLIKSIGILRTPEDVHKIRKDLNCENLRKRFFSILKQLWEQDEQNYLETGISPAVDFLFKQGLFWTVDKKEAFVSKLFSGLRLHAERLGELIEAAMDLKQVNDLTLCVQNANHKVVQVKTVETTQESKLLAWFVIFEK